MSSRIYRPQAASDAPSIAWRAQNGAAAYTPSRVQESRPDAHELQKELEARTEGAYQRGLTAGETAAAQRIQARADQVLAGLNSVIAELTGLRKTFRAQAEADTVALAVAIARRVLNRELTADPDAILGLVKAAFQKCDSRETHKLRVSPQDAEAIREHRTRLNLPPALEIVADGVLVRGSAIFETSRGDLDASMDAQLGEIERGLADVLRRRNP
jgi:flagellar assembly protein FliH